MNFLGVASQCERVDSHCWPVAKAHQRACAQCERVAHTAAAPGSHVCVRGRAAAWPSQQQARPLGRPKGDDVGRPLTSFELDRPTSPGRDKFSAKRFCAANNSRHAQRQWSAWIHHDVRHFCTQPTRLDCRDDKP